MGRLKLTNYKNHFPLPPHQLYIELSGEAIKFYCEGKEIRLKTTENLNYHRTRTKIEYAIDLLLDSIELK